MYKVSPLEEPPLIVSSKPRPPSHSSPTRPSKKRQESNNDKTEKINSPTTNIKRPGTSSSASSPTNKKNMNRISARKPYSLYSNNNGGGDDTELIFNFPKVRIGAGTIGTGQRGDTNFESTEAATARNFKEWCHKKNKERESANDNATMDSSHKYIASSTSRGRNNNNNNENSNSPRASSARSSSLRRSHQQPPPTAFVSKLRAQERDSWARRMYNNELKQEQLHEEKAEEKKFVQQELNEQHRKRTEYVAAIADSTVAAKKREREEMKERILEERRSNKGWNFTAADEEVDPKEVLERLHQEKLVAKSKMPSDMLQQIERQRQERQNNSEFIHEMRSVKESENRKVHDEVAIDLEVGKRVAADEKEIRLADIQNEALSLQKYRYGLIQEQEEARKQRIKQLEVRRGLDATIHYEKMNERILSVHDTHEKIVERSREDEKKRKDRIRDAEKQAREAARQIRENDFDSPRRKQEDCLTERQVTVRWIKKELKERREEYREEAEAEMSMKRKEYRRKLEEYRTSRPSTAASTYSSSLRDRLHSKRSAREMMMMQLDSQSADGMDLGDSYNY